MRFCFLLASFFTCLCLHGQSARLDLGLAHQWNSLDRDVALTATQYWDDNGFRIGLHFFQHTAQERPEWYRPRARTFGQHIGFSMAYERRIRLPEGDLELYPFIGVQYFTISFVSQNEHFEQFVEEPSSHLHLAPGVLGKVKLHRRIYLQGSASLGPDLSWQHNKNVVGNRLKMGGLPGAFMLGALWRFGQ